MLWGQTALKSTISHKLLKYPLVIVIVIVIVLFFILKIKLHNLLIRGGKQIEAWIYIINCFLGRVWQESYQCENEITCYITKAYYSFE